MKLITMQCSAASLLLPSPYELQEFVAAPRPQSSYSVLFPQCYRTSVKNAYYIFPRIYFSSSGRVVLDPTKS